MITDTVVLNKDETSSMVMSWAHDITCCSSSLWLLLEKMTSEEEIRERALITLVVKTLEEVNEQINNFEIKSL
ncbi:TPA: hypothetical protein J0595_003731 [Escherichia coli]|nr:hypothetical protein [Escherichia coli]HBB1748052.1 hypothetical protein [Escherichia coli]HCO6507141.1 hypothetical protein [Escherichia coli]HCO7019414.1 hypothetical protein [Escherichia coli]HDP8038558.1 hypothetical protein [Escherichia coli]